MSSDNPGPGQLPADSSSGEHKNKKKKRKPRQKADTQQQEFGPPQGQQTGRQSYSQLVDQHSYYSDTAEGYMLNDGGAYNQYGNQNIPQQGRGYPGNQYTRGRGRGGRQQQQPQHPQQYQQQQHPQQQQYQQQQFQQQQQQWVNDPAYWEALRGATQPRGHHSQRGRGQHQQQQQRHRGQHSGSPRGQRHMDGQDEAGSAQKKNQNRTQKGRKKEFEDYLEMEQVQQGLKRGEIIQGALRINPKNYADCYIPHPDGHSDIYISGLKDRNRALNGDIVAVFLYSREQWKVLMDDLNCLSEDDVAKSMQKLHLTESSQGTSKNNDTEPEEDTASAKEDPPVEEQNTEEEVIIEEEYYEVTGTESKDATKSDIAGASSSEVTSPVSDVRSKQSTRSKSENKSPRDGEKSANIPTKDNKSGKDHTPRKAYTSLGDLESNHSGLSPAAKKLFHQGTEEGKTSSHLPDNVLMRTGKVVYIVEKKHSRAATGHIKILQDNNPDLALFAPLDSRLPRILIPMEDCPKDFMERPADHAKTLFIAQITSWPVNSKMAKGLLKRSLGEAGQIEPETEGILTENDVDSSEFSDGALACLPQDLPWHIPADEIAKRRDLRQQCIFTIDPATARDLDDALSCVPLGNGRYEIGVHIADVSYFVHSKNDLDRVAASRATSVYLVQKVVPMLPRLLCEKLCSLNPDEDRLTFSVIWTIAENGTVEAEWFGRSVIRSCVKLSYDHAQGFIEEPTREWTTEELPRISAGYTVEQIKNTVLNLQKVAKNLRQQRFESGALRLDQIKLQYALDKETGMPCGYYVYHQRDSNKLVEEFMLMANMAVARKIYSHFPELAVLRRHPKPQSRMIDDLAKLCHQLGVPLDVTNSKSIQESLAAYSGDCEDDQAKLLILTALCSKPMQNAKYFCTGVLDDEEMYHHYALNVPFYTHFTSPIRRYPDIMVHRLLAASLEYCPAPDVPKGEVQVEAEHCNDKKTNAKRCSDLSSELFFAVFLKETGTLEERGMVMAVLDKSFDVLVLKLGVIKRVYCEKLALASHNYRKDKKTPELTLIWSKDEKHPEEKRQVISIFTRVNCRLIGDDIPLKWHAITLHPDDNLSCE